MPTRAPYGLLVLSWCLEPVFAVLVLLFWIVLGAVDRRSSRRSLLLRAVDIFLE